MIVTAMWSKRFLWAGVSSGVITAAVAYLGILLLLFIVFSGLPTRSLPYFVSWGIGGCVIYVVCWFYVIFRHRNYSIGQTSVLLTYTYLIFGAFVVVGFFCLGVWTILAPPAYGVSWSVAEYLTVPSAAMIGGIGISFTGLIPYVLIFVPTAYLQRYLLFWLFRPASY